MARRRVDPKVVLRQLVDGPKTFTELLESCGLSRPTLASLLKELEGRGLIRAELDRVDRRRIFYILTDELGVATIKEAISIIEKELDNVGEHLNDAERDALEKLLRSDDAREWFLSRLKLGEDVNIEKEVHDFVNGIIAIWILRNEVRNTHVWQKSKHFAEKLIVQTAARGARYLLKLYEFIPHSFVAKWVKTKAFQTSIIMQVLTALIQGLKGVEKLDLKNLSSTMSRD